MTDRDVPRKAQDTLARLAKASDRTSPTVFAGRGDEVRLLNNAVDGVQHDESGHTVVIQGVPGAGKTSLLNEYAARLLAANSESERLVVPVPLQPAAVNQPPLAIIHEIDRAFSLLEKSNEWRRAKNRAFSGASFVGHALFTAMTRKRLDDFRPSARSPTSLPRRSRTTPRSDSIGEKAPSFCLLTRPRICATRAKSGRIWAHCTAA